MEGQIFHGGKVNMTLASWMQCSRLQKLHWCCYWFFCCIHCSSDLQCFSTCRYNPQKLPLPFGRSGSLFNTLVPRAHPSLSSDQHLDQFSRFCRAHEHDQQTDTDRPCYSICSNRPL